MAFMIDPNEGNSSSGSARPDVRAGRKIVACAGIEYGTTMAGNPKWSTTWVVVHDPDGGQDVGALFWETLPLTQSAAWKIRIIAQALGQRTSWNAEVKKEMWEVLSRRCVSVDMELEESRSGRTDDQGNPKMDPRVKRWNHSAFTVDDESQRVIDDARTWYRGWSEKRSGGSGTARVTSSAPPSWDGPSTSGVEDDIPF